MYAAKGKSVDIRVTGNHRMVVKKPQTIRNLWTREWRLCEAADMASYGCRYRIPVSGIQEACGIALTDDELRFIGWFLTDGHLERNGSIGVGQAIHQPQLKDLIACIKGCGFDYKMRKRKVYAGALPGARPFVYVSVPKGTCAARPRNGWHELEPYIDKNLSPLLENLSERQFEVLLHAIHLGDGCKDRLPGSYRITTGNPVFASRLQSLCVRRGFRCNIRTKPVPDVQTGAVKQTVPILVLNIKKMSEITLQGKNSIGNQTGMRETIVIPGEKVWCVENPLGTLVVRRNGKVAIVGNSGAVFKHGFPDEDTEWTLTGNVDADYASKHKDGLTPKAFYCKHCELAYQGSPGCPQCGREPAKVPKSIFAAPPLENTNEILTEAERGGGKNVYEREEKIKHWMRCLAVAANRNGTFGMAGAIFKKKYDEFPGRDFPCIPANWGLKVLDVYPKFKRGGGQ
jgi:hypothetical protein